MNIFPANHTGNPYAARMHAVAETLIVSRRADALLGLEARATLINMLASDPMAGTLVPGLGGIRKLRLAPAGRRKSGAFRVIYYFTAVNPPILALIAADKAEHRAG